MTGTETWYALYGNSAGRWMVLHGTLNFIPPPTIRCSVPGGSFVELAHMGSPNDCIMQVYTYLLDEMSGVSGKQGGRGSGGRVQQLMADMFGVTQQSVSRYLLGKSEPSFPSPEGWVNLVRMYFAATAEERDPVP